MTVKIKNSAINWLEGFFSVFTDNKKIQNSKNNISIRVASLGIAESKFIILNILIFR